MGQVSNIQAKHSVFLTVADKDVLGVISLSTEGCSTQSDKESYGTEEALPQSTESPPSTLQKLVEWKNLDENEYLRQGS